MPTFEEIQAENLKKIKNAYELSYTTAINRIMTEQMEMLNVQKKMVEGMNLGEKQHEAFEALKKQYQVFVENFEKQLSNSDIATKWKTTIENFKTDLSDLYKQLCNNIVVQAKNNSNDIKAVEGLFELAKLWAPKGEVQKQILTQILLPIKNGIQQNVEKVSLLKPFLNDLLKWSNSLLFKDDGHKIQQKCISDLENHLQNVKSNILTAIKNCEKDKKAWKEGAKNIRILESYKDSHSFVDEMLTEIVDWEFEPKLQKALEQFEYKYDFSGSDSSQLVALENDIIKIYEKYHPSKDYKITVTGISRVAGEASSRTNKEDKSQSINNFVHVTSQLTKNREDGSITLFFTIQNKEMILVAVGGHVENQTATYQIYWANPHQNVLAVGQTLQG